MHKPFIILAFLFLPFAYLSGQKMVYDSVLIEFGYINNLKVNAFAERILDKRLTKPTSIGVYEVYKYLVVPVDKYVMLHQPLSYEIKGLFTNIYSAKKYKIEIQQFDVHTGKKSFLSVNYLFDAALSVYSISGDTEKYEGTFIYENTVTKTRKNNVGYESILDDWKIKFVEDMQNFMKCDDSCNIYNFRKEPHAWKKNMIIYSEFAVGPGSWLVDGEVVFSRPESEKNFNREGTGLRFRKEKKYESFETSVKNSQNLFRLNNNFLFALKLKTFVGLNRWNVDEYQKHGLEDIFLVDLSFSQHIIYNRFYKKGITAGIGIMEDVTYIYTEHFKFHPYLMLQLGIKL